MNEIVNDHANRSQSSYETMILLLMHPIRDRPLRIHEQRLEAKHGRVDRRRAGVDEQIIQDAAEDAAAEGRYHRYLLTSARPSIYGGPW